MEATLHETLAAIGSEVYAIRHALVSGEDNEALDLAEALMHTLRLELEELEWEQPSERAAHRAASEDLSVRPRP